MDPTEDLSARVLLKDILRTEPPRSPITRSDSKTQNTSPSRRSSRLSNKAAVAQTPQDILRRSLRQKIRESITRKSLTSTKRRTAPVVHRKTNTATTASMLFDDGDTPRHILKNILMTEPVRSPVVHKKTEAEEPQPSSANASITSKRSSIELSGLDLPDITIGNAASTARGLSRKRPRRSLNVTAFEKRLKDADDIGEESEESVRDHSSLSLSSSNLSLKTPFADVQTEKRGLQRRASHRRKVTEEEFGTAVDKRQTGEVSSVVGKGPSETAYSEGFTLGLSKLSEPDITTDIVHCNTALYAQPDAIPSSISIVATQDKTTVMSSQLQRQLIDADQEELMEVEQNKWKKEGSAYLFPTEDVVVAQPEIEDLPFEDNVDADKSSEEERKGSDDKSEDAAAMLKSEEEEGTVKNQTFVIDDKSKPEEEERRVESQTEDVPDSQHEEDGVMESNIEDCRARSQSEKEEAAPDSQMKDTTEGGGGDDSQPEEDATGRSQSEEEEAAPDFQIDNTTARGSGDDSQHEEDAGGRSESEEEEPVTDSRPEEEEDEVDAETKELAATDSLSVEEENIADNQKEPDSLKELDFQPGAESDEELEEEDHLGGDGEHITRRAHCSGGGVMPVTEAEGGLTGATETGWSEKKSRAHGTLNKYSSLETGDHEGSQAHSGIPDLASSSTSRQMGASFTEADGEKENAVRLSVEGSEHLSSDPPEQAAEQEEEWEDEEEEEEEEEREGLPSKTPAFVREKRIFSQPDPLASPSVLKNVQTRGTGESGPSPKPKQVRKRAKPAKREGGLPKAYLMGVFKHFAKMKVSADVYPILKEIMDKFFERLAEDLETYALHAKRKTIEIEDAELLLRRQGYVNDKVPVEVLIEKFLRMDQRRLLIPIATSGNVVIPKKR